jgi:hypothetical protein
MALPSGGGSHHPAIIQLATVLVACAFLLVPSQATTLLGIELTALGIVSAVLLAVLLLRRRAEIEERYRRLSDVLAVMAVVDVLLFAVAGVTVMVGAGGGLYWLIPATLLCTCRAILDSWVLLVEINR